MAQLTVQAAAIDDPVDGLVNLYVLVSDCEGALVAGLPAEAFACTATTPSGLIGLRNESAVEQASGCYRIAFFHEPETRIELLTLSVQQKRRSNPIGLAPVHETVAEGHELVVLRKRGFEL